MGFWLALFAPLLLGLGQGWASAILLVGSGITMAWMRLDQPIGFAHSNPEIIRHAAECAAPALFLPLATWGTAKSPAGSRKVFWLHCASLAQAYVLVALSLLIIFSSFDPWPYDDPSGTRRTALLAIIATLALAAFLQWRLESANASADPKSSIHNRASLLAVAALATTAIHPLSGSALATGLLFLALWGGIATCAPSAPSIAASIKPPRPFSRYA